MRRVVESLGLDLFDDSGGKFCRRVIEIIRSRGLDAHATKESGKLRFLPRFRAVPIETFIRRINGDIERVSALFTLWHVALTTFLVNLYYAKHSV